MNCEGCHWHRPEDPNVTCINLPMDEWKPKPTCRCSEYITTEDYRQSGAWAELSNVVQRVETLMEQQPRKTAEEAWEDFQRHYMPVELKPSYHGEECPGNGEHEAECQCEECDFYSACFPDYKPCSIWDETAQRFV